MREVQFLLRANDVEDARRRELPLAVERCRQVTGVVEGCAVTFAQKAWHFDAELLQRNDLRAFAFLEHSGGFDALHRVIHLVFEERLAGNVIERHAEARVGPLECLQRFVAQHLPHTTFDIVLARLKVLEVVGCFLQQVGVLLRFTFELLVELEHMPHRGLVQLGFVAEVHVGRHHLRERHAPITKVVDAVHGRAEVTVDAAQGVAEHRATHVADVERLRDVR